MIDRAALAATARRCLGSAGILALVGCTDPTWQSLESGSGNVQTPSGPSLFYRTLGRGPDTVIVLHGGVGLHHEYLLQPLASLVPGRTLIFYDMRGRGRSSEVTDSAALTFDQDVADLESVRQHFKLRHLTLLGHHWGAAVAALYSARHPGIVSRMVLLSPFPVHNSLLYEITFVVGDTARYQRALHLGGLRSSPDSIRTLCPATWSLFFAPWRTDTATPYDRLAEGVCDASPERLAQANWILVQEQRSLGQWTWRTELNTDSVPTMVVEGSGTALVSEFATRWAQHLPNARVLLLPPPYLFPWVGAPRQFRGSVGGFLDGTFPDGAIKPSAWKPN